jgi:hypothetical protein
MLNERRSSAAFLALPLDCHCRCGIFAVDDVNNVAKNWSRMKSLVVLFLGAFSISFAAGADEKITIAAAADLKIRHDGNFRSLQ